MNNESAFGEVHDIEVTILVDNRADLIVSSTETVKRFTEGPLLAFMGCRHHTNNCVGEYEAHGY